MKMNIMPAFVQLASMSFECILFLFMIRNKISTEMPLQENLYFMKAHTDTHLSYWYHDGVYTKTIYLYRSTFYVEGNLYTHPTMPTCFILLRFTHMRHIRMFQQWRNKDISIIIITYELIAAGWRIHVSGIQLGIH